MLHLTKYPVDASDNNCIGRQIDPEETLSERQVTEDGAAKGDEPRSGDQLRELHEVGGD